MADLWVFGYGSLIWRSGFDFAEAIPARLFGAHRALCVYSWVHRGTREQPGLVLGLDRGGSCRGVAFRVAAADRRAVIGYLREREMVTEVYVEAWRRVAVAGVGDPVSALSYVVDRDHQQYAGRLPLERQLSLVRNSRGQSGDNAEYVVNTSSHLKELGVRDPILDWLSRRLSGAKQSPFDQL